MTIMRGCFGGCSFCSITEHEGRIIQSRSEGSILHEIETIRDKTEGFTGIISDIGGPTANMYRMACKDKETEALCRRPSCVYPDICKNLNTSHDALIQLYRKARAIPGRQEGDGGVRRALRSRREEPGLCARTRRASCRRLSEDRARAYRERPAVEDDEAGHRLLRPLQAVVRRGGAGGEEGIFPHPLFHRGPSGHDGRGHDESGALAEAQQISRRSGADVPALADGAVDGHVSHAASIR